MHTSVWMLLSIVYVAHELEAFGLVLHPDADHTRRLVGYLFHKMMRVLITLIVSFGGFALSVSVFMHAWRFVYSHP